jgi:hypothetical protein
MHMLFGLELRSPLILGVIVFSAAAMAGPSLVPLGARMIAVCQVLWQAPPIGNTFGAKR